MYWGAGIHNIVIHSWYKKSVSDNNRMFTCRGRGVVVWWWCRVVVVVVIYLCWFGVGWC
jgi:hypothetical protein